MTNRNNLLLIAFFKGASVLLKKATGVGVKSVVCLVGTIHMILFTDELGETLVRH